MSVEHQINFVSIALNELVLSSDDSGNLEKVEPVLSLIMFTFYNQSCFEVCLKDGLFNKLIKLFSNVKQLDSGTPGSKQRKESMNSKLKLQAIFSIVHAINFCFDLTKERIEFSELVKIRKDEFESLTLSLQLIEEEIDNVENVQILLSFMLRVLNLAYNPDARAV